MENQYYLKNNPIGEGFWKEILNYHWPGNIRELITFLKRAGIMLKGPITGEDVRSVLGNCIHPKSSEINEERIHLIWEDLEAGKSFWDGLWSLFISREVDRYFVKEILKKAYVMSSGNFKAMLNIINVNPHDYRKFMSLMYKYKIDPRY
jgi:DNA-binding NtrC family response regulator